MTIHSLSSNTQVPSSPATHIYNPLRHVYLLLLTQEACTPTSAGPTSPAEETSSRSRRAH